MAENIDWDKYKLVDGPKAGDKQKAEITKISETTWRKYLTDQGKADKIDSFERPDDPQLCIAVKAEDGKDIEQLFSMPKGDEISKISNLGMYNELYKKFPEVGDEIELMADKNGFWNVFVGRV